MSFVQYARHPDLDRPLMVCAFLGWNDGGEAASTAAHHLKTQWAARRFARMDPEEFFDFQVNRPTVRLVEGTARRIDWPSCDLFHASPGGRDVVLLIGVEPNVRWRTFADTLVGTAGALGVEVMVTLGAFLADVPHTMPPPVNAASSDPAWLTRPGITPARYEGPTGIVGVLHDSAGRAGLPSVSLWGAAPHYLPSGTNPKVAVALLERLRDLFGLEIDTGELEQATAVWEQKIAEAVAEDAELREYVQRLEKAAASRDDLDEMPSADDLAAEVERFLRDQGGG